MTPSDAPSDDDTAREHAASPSLSPGFETRLHVDGVVFDAADATLLRTIATEGSLNAAATALGRSYSRVHDRVTTLESALGPLVERRRGGTGGGGSRLTPRARTTLTRFARLQTALAGTAAVPETVFEGRCDDATGDPDGDDAGAAVLVVETAAGPVRAVPTTDPDRADDTDRDRDATGAVHVTVRADAVTLHAPATAPSPDATSARNRLPGTVTTVTPWRTPSRVASTAATGADDGPVAVSITVAGDQTLMALVTPDSRRRLSLAPDRAVVATWKATATRVTPR